MADHPTKYILYHDPSSLCSIMVRYTFALRGKPVDSNADMDIYNKVCSLKAKEQLTEHYLCNINGNGEVPVLVPETGDLKPMPESVDITYAIASRYPSLLPQEHENEIKSLIRTLHDINFFSLIFAGKPEMQLGNLALLERKLGEDISEKYRKAIEHKIQRARSHKLNALEPQEVQRNVDKAAAYLAEIEVLVERSNTDWILNTTQPTALDGHVVVFVCRLQDIGRNSLIPETVRRYADVAMRRPAWTETMKGQRTMGAAKPYA